ncbi:MAG: hypothetical protein JNK05_28730 [Myxococcales bacterium]|nr:hypothetical protein [Myxococcales bacterium]
MIARWRRASVIVVALCALGSCTQPTDSRGEGALSSGGARDGDAGARQGSNGPSMIDDPEALAAVARHPRLAGRSVIALGEARVGTRSVLIVWPAFDATSARPASDDTVGATIELGSDGRLAVIDAGWNPRDRTGRALALQLGTDRYERIDRSRGATLDELPAKITEAFNGFAAACAAGDRGRATSAAQAMASLFAWEVVAFEDVVTEMLWAAASGDYQLAHGETTLLDGGRRARVTAVITYRGTAHRIGVIATPRGDASGRWVITSEEPND